MLATSRRRIVAACLAWLCGPAATLAQEAGPQGGLGDRDLVSFLVQCIGTDRTGGPTLPSPAQPNCPTFGLQRDTERVLWRKHDWPDHDDARAARLGYLASDAVLASGYPFPVVLQTGDFGDPPRRFGSYDRGNGDGGDVLAVLDGAVYGVFTEDGGAGRQWFLGEGCGSGGPARLKSWLFFGRDVRRGGWTETVARLGVSRSLTSCPARLGSALTRYRRETITVPVRAVREGAPGPARPFPLDTVVSEHFDRPEIGSSAQLERFFFGRGLGKYRWEHWEALDRSRLPNGPARAQQFAATGRCGPLPFSDPPGPGWALTDCRMWTNLVRQAAPYAASSYGWPGDALDELH